MRPAKAWALLGEFEGHCRREPVLVLLVLLVSPFWLEPRPAAQPTPPLNELKDCEIRPEVVRACEPSNDEWTSHTSARSCLRRVLVALRLRMAQSYGKALGGFGNLLGAKPRSRTAAGRLRMPSAQRPARS